MRTISGSGLRLLFGASLALGLAACADPRSSGPEGSGQHQVALAANGATRPQSRSPAGKRMGRVVLSPVKADPAGSGQRDVSGTATFQQGVSPDASFQHHGADIWQCDPNANYGTDGMFVLGRNDGGTGAPCFAWPYLKFDLSGTIPAGAIIEQATVSMYAYDGYGAYQTGGSHKVLSAWDESTLTYNNKPPDWSNGITESQVLVTGINSWWDWDVTQMVSDWVADPASNHGLAILPLDTLYDGDFLVWHSDDAASSALRPRLTVDYLVPEHRALFVGQVAPPTSMFTGQRTQVRLTYQNDGADSWTDTDGYRLGSQSPADNSQWGLNRVDLPGPIDQGEQVQFDFEITAPADPGTYAFQWQMRHEGVQWFGDPSPRVDVSVGRKPNGESCASGSECDNGNCVDQVCCDAGCLGTCMSCVLPNYVGNCRFVPAGQDVDAECPGQPPCGASCNGMGACVYPSSGTPCADCASCDGSGNCSLFEPADSDPQNVCGLCRVCPGDGPDCVIADAGADPQAECAAADPSSCGQTGDCDGQGACALFPADTICASESCVADVYSPADRCDGGGQCVDSPPQACQPYTCLDASTCRSDCSDDAHCQGDAYCLNGACAAYLQRGQPCSEGFQCISGRCVDEVCCDSDCLGICQTCNLAADPGGCYPSPDGQDPREDCPGTGLCGGVCDGGGSCRFPPADLYCDTCTTCDGAGACAVLAAEGSDPFDDCAPCWACSGQDSSCRVVSAGDDPLNDCPSSAASSCGTSGTCDGSGNCRLWPADTVCQASQCADGIWSPADTCDGAGVCQEGGQVDCAPFTCLSDESCRSDCQQDEDCLAGTFCQDSGCLPVRSLGDSCDRGSQCQSGICSDSVCCGQTCDQACHRCDQATAPGTCTPVPQGQDPDEECAGQGLCGGSCDGGGACALPGQETACGPCARCDGQGQCNIFIPAGEDPDDACGPCLVCSGLADACVPVPAGTDPLDECPREEPQTCGADGGCSGQGACRLWISGTACGPQACIAGMLQRAPTCDGSGSCTDRGSIPCDPYTCDGPHCAGPADLAAISIEDAPDGSGLPITDRNLTTDDQLEVFAVGRDATGASLGPVMVTWLVEGEIGVIPPGPSVSAVFDPRLPGQGRVLADFYLESVVDGASGTIQVGPGLPAGQISLDPQPPLLPADGQSESTIFAGPVLDADGNPVTAQTPITVICSAGTLVSSDLDATEPGLQRFTDSAGDFAFVVRAASQPGRAQLRALALAPATARGDGVLYFGDGLPVAEAGPDQTAQVGQRIQLDGSASFDPLDRPLDWSWTQLAGDSIDLQDADTAEPSFTVPDSPVSDDLQFQLTVSAADQTSLPDTVTVLIDASHRDRPQAVLRIDPDRGPAPLAVELDGSDSVAAPCCQLTEFLWLFTDGAPTQRGATAQRSFADPGGVGVALLVIDDRGHFDLATGQVMVGTADNQAPRLSLAATPMTGEVPLQVFFSAEASDPDGQLGPIEWDFGGGFGPTGVEQTRLYSQAGRHVVRVRVTDDQGLSSQAAVQLFLSDGGLLPPAIVSSPGLQARVGEVYAYDPIAVGSTPLSFSLGREVGGQTTGAPVGAIMDPTDGSISWVPSSDQQGPQQISLVVRNEAGVDFQDINLEVWPADKRSDGCGCGQSGASSALLWGLLALALLLRRRSGGHQSS